MDQNKGLLPVLYSKVFGWSTPSCLKVIDGGVVVVGGPCDYCVSPSPNKLDFWVFMFQTWSKLRVRIWGLLGQGIGDLDLGLTMNHQADDG